MKIIIGSDHHGFKKKDKIKRYLEKKGNSVIDVGPLTKESVDYPKYSFLLGETLIRENIDFGILMCGTGIGVSIAANKVKGIKCAKIDSIGDAKYAKKHNNANVIAFSAEKPFYLIKDMIDKFIKEDIDENTRHQTRRKQIEEYDNVS